MTALAVLTRTGYLLGGLDQWRRTTGVLRAHLCAAPLVAFTHPDDVGEYVRLFELAELRDVVGALRIGYHERRVLCRVALAQWAGHRSAIQLTPIVPLSTDAWWLPADTYAAQPAMPTALWA